MIKLISQITLIVLTLASSNIFAQDNNCPEIPCGPPPFNKLDMDGDGAITLDEFSQHKIPHGDHQTLFSRIDANNDGEIVEQELLDHKQPHREKSKPISKRGNE